MAAILRIMWTTCLLIGLGLLGWSAWTWASQGRPAFPTLADAVGMAGGRMAEAGMSGTLMRLPLWIAFLVLAGLVAWFDRGAQDRTRIANLKRLAREKSWRPPQSR